MKAIFVVILIVLSLSVKAEDLVNGAIFVKHSPEGQSIAWIGQNTKTNELLKVGKTYGSEKEIFELVTTNASVTLQLSSGLLVQVSPNSEFRVDAFNQMIADANVQPEALKTGDFLLNVALMNGSANFVAPKYASLNTMCVLQTPLMNLDLNDGKYHIKTSQKYTAIYVLEGSIGIFDNLTNKKVTKKAGVMIWILPSPIKATETMITEKVLDTEETRKMTAQINELESSKPSVLFIIDTGKIKGVKLN